MRMISSKNVPRYTSARLAWACLVYKLLIYACENMLRSAVLTQETCLAPARMSPEYKVLCNRLPNTNNEISYATTK